MPTVLRILKIDVSSDVQGRQPAAADLAKGDMERQAFMLRLSAVCISLERAARGGD